MKIDRFVDDRRVKQRHRGGIQTPDHMCSEDAPHLLRGFFYQLGHVKTTGPERTFWGDPIPAPTCGLPREPIVRTPELVEPLMNIITLLVGERRANEVCIDESEVREHKHLEGD